jgi:hypothetical protein
MSRTEFGGAKRNGRVYKTRLVLVDRGGAFDGQVDPLVMGHYVSLQRAWDILSCGFLSFSRLINPISLKLS